MIYRIEKRYSKDEVLGLLDPIIREWFESKFKDITEPQAYAIPYIHKGKNVLVSSPTGSGKTLTGFLAIINELFLLAKQGKLEDKVYCVYVSPLKALANDIHRNLEEPLEEINQLAKKKGIEIPKINVAVRSGDTPQNQRQKMLRKPPHIFITTPESLALVLSSLKFKERFRNVKYLIIDETHELSSNKRGVMLSLNAERLERLTGHLIRIGLSATQSPIEEMAKFVAGYDDNGEVRDIYIAEVEAKKSLDLKVITPVPDLVNTPYEIANERMYDILVDIINSHKTTLIFTNTRSGTEHVAFKLRERGIKSLEAHHSSLGKATRLRVEEMLKRGELKCVISSTSLELGIDIGYIDMVVQIGSPKSIAKGLQRIGRSGHKYGDISRGRMVVFDMDDLIECTVITKAVYENNIDRVFVPKNSLDVLAQVLVGMSLEDVWSIDEAYKLIKRSYCYHDLKKEKFLEVLDYLSGKSYGETFYSKIWYDEKEGVFGKKRSSRMIFFMNMGTIPEEADYVVLDENNVHLGELSEKFVERLRQGDIFVLGARTYEFLRVRGSRVYVRSAEGKRPTVPSWAGEMLPRSFDLSLEVGKFRKEIMDMIKKKEDVVKYLMDEYYLDYSGAVSIYKYIMEQIVDYVPTNEGVLIEGYVDPSRLYNIIFHFPFGRRVNDALSRAYAYHIANRYNINTRITVTDDAFMISTNKKIPIDSIPSILKAENLEKDLRNAIKNTELFKQRFRHCATRSFMILRKYKGADISVTKQQLKSDKILEILSEIPNFPVIEETYNEIFNIVMDLPNAREILHKIENGEIEVKLKEYSEEPSIFSNNIILASISDIVLMEDRSSLLKEIHMKILKKVLPEESVHLLEPEEVKNYFRNKFSIENENDIIKFIENVGAADVLSEKGVSIYSFSKMKFEDLKDLSLRLIKEKKLRSVFTDRAIFTVPEYVPYYMAVYSKGITIDETIEKILKNIDGKTTTEIWKLSGLKREIFMDVLRNLERAYLIERVDIRDNEMVWAKRDGKPEERKKAIKFLIQKILSYYGPITLSEIAFYLNTLEDEVSEPLKELLKEGIVLEGNFLPGYEKQYMLADDFKKLKPVEFLTKEDLKNYRFTKLMRKENNLDDIFRKYLVFTHPYQIYVRFNNFSYNEWLDMKKKDTLVYGRFLANRYFFTTKDIAYLFKYRDFELDDIALKILGKLRSGIMDVQEISKSLELHPKTVKNYLSLMEKNLIVSRSLEEHDAYISLNIEGNGNIKDLIKKLIDNLGPLTVKDLEYFLDIPKENIMPLINEMNIGRIVVGGNYYYGEFLKTERSGQIVMLPEGDPFLLPYQFEILEKFGEGFNYFIVKDGEIVGSADIEDMGDHLHIFKINCPKELYEFFIDKVLELSNFLDYSQIILSNVTDELQPALKKYKFEKHGNFYSSSKVSGQELSYENLYRYVFRRQGLDVETRAKNIIELEKMFPGLRSDLEALIRTWRFISLERLKRSGILYLTHGIPPIDTYASMENIVLFKSIKNARLEKIHESVLKMVKELQYDDEILNESPFGEETTKNALDYLYKNNYIVKGTRDEYLVVENKMDREYAIKVYVEKLFNIFGALNIKRIMNITYGMIDIEDLKRALNSIYKENKISNVFFNDELFYLPKDDVKHLKSKKMDLEIILDPHDIVYLYLQNYIKNYVESGKFVILKGLDIIGSFRAMKRKTLWTIYEFSGSEHAKVVLESVMRSMGIKIEFKE